MIITCPNCHTKYEVADQAIGSAGRKVLCANCHQSWKATASLPVDVPPRPRIVGGTDTDIEALKAEAAEHDRLFGQDSEAALDEAFVAEETRMAEKDAVYFDTTSRDETEESAQEEEEDIDSLDHNLLSRRKRDLLRRQKKHAARLPAARLRRLIRMVTLITLMTLVGMAYQFRIDIVRAYPDLGGLYAAVGLEVNIYGLIFTNVETLRTLKDGEDVTIITAKIRSVVDHTVRVPSILVSILNADGTPIYEWTARAPVDNISPGDIVAFQTQLTSAPADAAHVRLVFGSSAASQETATAAQENRGAR